MNYVSIIFESLERQKRYHLKNIGMINNMYDKDDYVDMMKEDYIVSFHIRNTVILREYKKRFLNNLITENNYSHKKDVINFFEFLKKSALVEIGLVTTKIYSMVLNEQSLRDLWNKGTQAVTNTVNAGVNLAKKAYNKGAQVVKKTVDKGKQVVKKVVDKGKQVVKKTVAAVSPYVKKVLDSQFAYFVPGLNVIKLGRDAQKIYDNWEKIKKMTLDDWVEAFRNFLNGGVGIAIQIVLALTGVGNAANIVVWALLLGYDLIYKGIIKGQWNIYNILTDCIGLIGTGAAAGAFKILKPILSGIKGLKGVGPAIAKAGPQIMSKVAPFMQKIGSGIGTIIQQLTKGINWLITKVPLIGKLLTPIKNGLGKVKPLLDDLMEGFNAHFKGKKHHGKQENSMTQYMKVHKGSHFDFPSVAQKLTALGDKKLTKKAIGGITSIVYTMIAGDTLQKVVAKYKLPGLDYLKKLNPNYASLGPGKQVVVGHM